MIQWSGQQFLDGINQRIDAQAIALAQKVVERARVLAPYESGYLRNSIDWFYDSVTKTIQFYVGAEYGIFQEFGTRNMPPHPYLRPALNEVGEIYGFETEMAFTNTFQTDTKLLAHGPTFQMHKSLSARQKAHVRNVLKPVSQKHWDQGRSNVARAKLSVKTVPGAPRPRRRRKAI